MKIADIISPKIAGPCMVPASGSRSWNSMPLGASRASRLVDNTLVELLWRSVPEKKTRPSKCWFSPFTIAIVFGYTTVYPCNHTPFMGKIKEPAPARGPHASCRLSCSSLEQDENAVRIGWNGHVGQRMRLRWAFQAAKGLSMAESTAKSEETVRSEKWAKRSATLDPDAPAFRAASVPEATGNFTMSSKGVVLSAK